MELVQDLILLRLININMSILSYFENKMEIPLIFVKDQQSNNEKIVKRK